MNINPLYDYFTGRCIREISTPGNALYLTFDDGPDVDCTPKVLDLLRKYNARATFFLIGNKARNLTELTEQMIEDGHTIGDHTLDHDTRKYFGGETQIRHWLEDSQRVFDRLNLTTVGFRSPLGIKTPPLINVLKQERRPLILWNVRFYDTKNGLTRKMVDKKFNDIKPGSIILLHDTHQGARQKIFLNALEHLLQTSTKNGMEFKALTKKVIEQSWQDKYETH